MNSSGRRKQLHLYVFAQEMSFVAITFVLIEHMETEDNIYAS